MGFDSIHLWLIRSNVKRKVLKGDHKYFFIKQFISTVPLHLKCLAETCGRLVFQVQDKLLYLYGTLYKTDCFSSFELLTGK